MHALLFLNGEPPKSIPDYRNFQLIACTDGAMNYLEKMNFSTEKLDFISGDFDSIKGFNNKLLEKKYVETPDQNYTDFHKALEILHQKGATLVEVYGASGREMDHFLGNLTVAFHFNDKINIIFHDEFSTYYFIPKSIILDNMLGKMVSLYPFPEAKNITTKGLQWSLNGEDLHILNRIGTRNLAIENSVSIQFADGDMVVFISHSSTGT